MTVTRSIASANQASTSSPVSTTASEIKSSERQMRLEKEYFELVLKDNEIQIQLLQVQIKQKDLELAAKENDIRMMQMVLEENDMDLAHQRNKIKVLQEEAQQYKDAVNSARDNDEVKRLWLWLSKNTAELAAYAGENLTLRKKLNAQRKYEFWNEKLPALRRPQPKQPDAPFDHLLRLLSESDKQLKESRQLLDERNQQLSEARQQLDNANRLREEEITARKKMMEVADIDCIDISRLRDRVGAFTQRLETARNNIEHLSVVLDCAFQDTFGLSSFRVDWATIIETDFKREEFPAKLGRVVPEWIFDLDFPEQMYKDKSKNLVALSETIFKSPDAMMYLMKAAVVNGIDDASKCCFLLRLMSIVTGRLLRTRMAPAGVYACILNELWDLVQSAGPNIGSIMVGLALLHFNTVLTQRFGLDALMERGTCLKEDLIETVPALAVAVRIICDREEARLEKSRSLYERYKKIEFKLKDGENEKDYRLDVFF